MKNGLLSRLLRPFGKANGQSGWSERHSDIFFSLPIGVAHLSPDLRYIRINKFIEDKHGITNEDAVGRPCHELMGGVSGGAIPAACSGCGLSKAVATGRPFRFNCTAGVNTSIENVGMPVKDKSGRVVEICALVFDLSERVEQEHHLQLYANHLEGMLEEKTNELAASKRFLNNVIEGTTDAIFTLDLDGRFVFLNNSAANIFGHTVTGLSGNKLLNIIHPADKGKIERALRLADRESADSHNLSLTVLSSDGSEKNQLMSLSPLSDDDASSRFVGVCKDITHERKLERERQEFITMVTHDLKTPLTTVIGYSDLLLGGDLGKVEGEKRGAVEGIRSSAQRMLNLIRNYLSADRIRERPLSIRREKTNIEEMVLESLRSLDPQLRDKGLYTETVFGPELPALSVDPEHMERVFSNIISNAVKFTPCGGKISVNAYHSDSFVTFEIADSGGGIPAEELPLLFEKYYKGSQHSHGSGLGLYIAKSIVEAHNGTINVQSHNGKGTIFTIRIPQDN
jgi:PAS domain S-box-containing protein